MLRRADLSITAKRMLPVPLIVMLSALACLLWMPQNSTAGVASSKHNLTATGTGTYHATTGAGSTEMCVFCHAPHHSRTAVAPLWNRPDSAATYQMYTSWSLKMTISASPSPVSLACLSCHDGTMTFDQLVNVPSGAATTWAGGKNILDANATSNIHADLRDDHPISLQYDSTKKAHMETLANAKIKGFKFFGTNGDMLECATCHDPHDDSKTYFLRGVRQTLCLQCHLMND